MGILGIPKPVMVVQCGHCANAKAFWSTKNDGSEAPDLWFEGMPQKGRMIMTNQVFYVACWQCRESLDAIVTDYVKAKV